jgi:hypothetical protein
LELLCRWSNLNPALYNGTNMRKYHGGVSSEYQMF